MLIIGLILYLFVQPNIENADGATALLSAVAAGSLPCLEVLLEVRSLNDDWNTCSFFAYCVSYVIRISRNTHK